METDISELKERRRKAQEILQTCLFDSFLAGIDFQLLAASFLFDVMLLENAE